MKANDVYRPAFESKKRYLILVGGAGSGKSVFAAQKICYRAWNEPKHKILVARKVQKTIKRSVYPLVKETLNDLLITYAENKTDLDLTLSNGNQILFTGLDDSEKIKSIHGITSIWMEEMSEFEEQDFEQLDLRLRGQTERYKQIIGTLNPVSQYLWQNRRFFQSNEPDALTMVTTYKDNVFIDREYIKKLERMRETNPQLWQIYGEGKWGVLEGQIYNWIIVESLPNSWDEQWFGLDFGFSVDPAALIMVYRKADRYYIDEMIYQTGMTNSDLIAAMKDWGVSEDAEIYADSAEPKSIEEISRAGYNIHPTSKAPNYKQTAIDYVKSLNVSVLRGSTNVIKEMQGYCWKKTRDGRATGQPAECNDHAMDAILYALYSHGKRYGNSNSDMAGVLDFTAPEFSGFRES
jgi:phage terminase large subunit